MQTKQVGLNRKIRFKDIQREKTREIGRKDKVKIRGEWIMKTGQKGEKKGEEQVQEWKEGRLGGRNVAGILKLQ